MFYFSLTCLASLHSSISGRQEMGTPQWKGWGSPTARGVTGGDVSGSDPRKHHQLEEPPAVRDPLGWCGARVLVCAQAVQCSQSSEESHQTLSAAAVSPYVTSNSLRPHRLQHVGLPCPSPSPRVHSDSCPLS